MRRERRFGAFSGGAQGERRRRCGQHERGDYPEDQHERCEQEQPRATGIKVDEPHTPQIATGMPTPEPGCQSQQFPAAELSGELFPGIEIIKVLEISDFAQNELPGLTESYAL